MRDFRDAKAMAQTLRDALAAKTVTISHSESLEITSKMLGASDWNTLSSLLQAQRPEVPRPKSYPALPMRDFVGFPTMSFPIYVGREKTKQALDQAFESQRDVVLVTQRNPEVDEPTLADVYEVGVLARVLERARQPDGIFVVLLQASRRVAIRRLAGEAGALWAEIDEVDEQAISDATDLVEKALARFGFLEKARRGLPDALQQIRNIRDPGRLADLLAQRMPWPLPEKQALLATIDPVVRLEKVIALMDTKPAVTPA